MTVAGGASLTEFEPLVSCASPRSPAGVVWMTFGAPGPDAILSFTC
jgi:hypothetical protein